MAINETFNNLSNWIKSVDTYSPFWTNNGITGTWDATNADIVDGMLRLKLVVTKSGNSVVAKGAEVSTTTTLGYGTYEFRMRAASTSATPTGVGTSASGMITAGFSYATESVTEIDVELQSHLPTTASLGHWNTLTNKQHTNVEVGVNLSQDFHIYKYIWKPTSIEFYVDGVLVQTNNNYIPSQAGSFLFNLWPTNSNDFGGVTLESGTYYAYVDYFTYTESTDSPIVDTTSRQLFPKLGSGGGNGGGNGYQVVEVLESNSKESYDAWSSYRYGVSYMAVFDKVGWPIAAGTIVTDNTSVDAAFTKQFAYPYEGSDIYVRSGLASGAWDVWTKVGDTSQFEQLVLKISSNSKLPTDSWTTYAYGITYMAYFQNTEATPYWPTSSGTVVTENMMIDAQYVRQTYYDTKSGRSFIRRVKTDGTWNEWVETGVTSKTSTVAKEAVLQNRKSKGMITFIMDDGFVEDYTIMYPMLQAKGYPAVVAMISSFINAPVPERLSVEQLLTLQSAGWEIASHTVNHPFLADISLADARAEIRDSKKTLEAVGLNITNFVYPYGNHNQDVRSIVREYYRAAFGTTSASNKMPLKQMDIDRVPMGSFLTAGQDTATYYKSMVDKAKNEGSWVVFLLHTGPNQQSAQQTQYIQETVNYIATQGVPVVTASQALDIMGNNLDAGDYPSGDYTMIAGDGKLYASNVAGLMSRVPQQTFTASTPASSFGLGVTYMVVGGADAGGFPTDVGTVRVEKMHIDNSFTRQTYYPYNTNKLLHRNWIDGAWSAWIEQKSDNVFMQSSIRNLNFGTVAAQSFSELNINITGISYGDNVIANPIYGLEGGLVWNVFPEVDAITIRVTNITAAPITPTVQDWTVTPLNVL